MFSSSFEQRNWIDNFWSKFHEEKTLSNALKHFVKNFDYENPDYRNIFAVEIIPKIMGRTVDTRKLRQFLELEMGKLDFAKIRAEPITNKININELSIFDADKLDGLAFEQFIAGILSSNDFTDVNVTRGSGDQGGDITANQGDEKLVIQAKRYSIDKKVTNSAVQEVIGAIAWYNGNRGVVVTNSIFTNSAKELAKKNNIELWDRQKVSKFIEVYNLKKNSKSEHTSSPNTKQDSNEKIKPCSNCHKENNAQSKFCRHCGQGFD